MCKIKELMARARSHLKPVVHEVPTEIRHHLSRYQVAKPDLYSTRYLKQYEKADWQGAPPDIRALAYRIYRRAHAVGLPMYAHSCWRSPALQQRLHDEGRSSLSSGAHQRSCAIDFVHCDFHWDFFGNTRDNPVALFWGTLVKECARVEGIEIVWGGDWRRPWDPAHVEVKDWRERPIVHNTSPLHLPIGKLKNQ